VLAIVAEYMKFLESRHVFPVVAEHRVVGSINKKEA
jgi:hypothetical protein